MHQRLMPSCRCAHPIASHFCNKMHSKWNKPAIGAQATKRNSCPINLDQTNKLGQPKKYPMKTPSPTSWRMLLLALFVTLRAAGQFSPVALPTGLQPTESEMVVYQNNLYLVLQNATHDSFSLHKYNGSVF